MVLQSDGYYVCSECGYRIKSPVLQDKEILDTEDYYKVLGCFLSLPYYLTVAKGNDIIFMLLNHFGASINEEIEIADKVVYIKANFAGTIEESKIVFSYDGKFKAQYNDTKSLMIIC